MISITLNYPWECVCVCEWSARAGLVCC